MTDWSQAWFLWQVNNEPVEVFIPWHICTDNSTQTPLLADVNFVWDWQDTINFWVVSISVNTDQDSATDWLLIEWSSDWVTVAQDDKFTILANKGKTFTFWPASRYVRISFTNWWTDQTFLELETSLRATYVKPSSHRIKDSIVADDDAELIKAVITWERADWIFSNATLSNSNRLRVVSQNYLYAVAEWDIPYHSPVRRFWHNTSVWTSLETVCPASTLYTYLTSAEQLRIVSSSASDTGAGVWAQSVFIQWLDTNYDLQSEVVILNWTTPVYTTKSYIRLLAAYNNSVWTSAANVWDISITNNAWTIIQWWFLAWLGRWNAAIFTVPAWKTFYMTSWYGSENSSKGSDISLWKREFWDGWWQKVRLYTILDGVFENEISMPLQFWEKTDIEVRAISTLAWANIAGWFYWWMEEN